MEVAAQPDFETSLLIARLALEDISDIDLSRKGKSCANLPPSDEEYAFSLQAEGIRNMLRSYEDFKIAQSMNDALTTDQAHLDAAAILEQGAADDRMVALALQQGRPIPASATPAQRLLEVLVMPVLSEQVLPAVVPQAAVRENSPFAIGGMSGRVECISCGDKPQSTSALRTPCGHFYCPSCVQNLALACTRDESLFPPTCCQIPLPLISIRAFLSTRHASQFILKSREFGTPTPDRIYCPSESCSTFLGSSKALAGNITCTSCGIPVCTACRQKSHTGNCAERAALGQLFSLAKEKRWQSCPGCHAIVELERGCHHITCRCRAEFCYVCAAPWKTCQCPQWEEARL
ncbi:hypothetical protein BD779DRAFT_223882 [Infundibulicybe gibba]|nr:hypothetical protein BD779DRAFT_223882 [Infundibulicybe gibba]